MKKLLLALLLVCPLLVVCEHAQDLVIQNNFYYPRADIGRALPAGTTYNQFSLSWVVNGQISACTASGCTQVGSAGCSVEVDSSPDNSTWTPMFVGLCAYPFLTSSGVKGPLSIRSLVDISELMSLHLLGRVALLHWPRRLL